LSAAGPIAITALISGKRRLRERRWAQAPIRSNARGLDLQINFVDVELHQLHPVGSKDPERRELRGKIIGVHGRGRLLDFAIRIYLNATIGS
jgi:hypothetical protein